MAIKVLICDKLAEEGVDILKDRGLEAVEAFGLKEDDLCEKIKGFHAMIVRSGTTVTEKIIKASDELQVIGRAGVGLDNIDIDAASKKGVVVMNAPSGNTVSTAEHAFSLMLSLSRNIPRANESLKSGKWDRKKFMGVEVYGKTLGVIGMGRIGTEFAKRALSFGMRIMAADPYLTEEKARSLNVEPVPMERLFSESDFITIHTPLTDETRHLIDAAAFDKMKKGVRIINAARGGILDEKALKANLESGKVAGAALDVFESGKKPPADSPVFDMDQVVTTPHLGASTEEAQLNVALDMARSVSDALLGKGYRNAVNVPVMEEESFEAVKPYAVLAEKLGSIQSQLIDSSIQGITVNYVGEIAKLDVSVITRALMKGIFDPILEENVNYVNSMLIAEERGIKISERKTTKITDFLNLISVEFDTGSQKHFIMGTLFSNKKPRIVKMNEYYVEAIPEGTMLVISNRDVPGVVGTVGTELAKHKINIAEMSFGRDKDAGEAISLCNIDSRVPKNVLEALKDNPDIHDVKQIEV